MPTIQVSPDDAEVPFVPEANLLTTLIDADIPIDHLCGGRGRCSTCRVFVFEGLSNVSGRTAPEEKMAQKLDFPERVRLACQTTLSDSVRLRRLVLDKTDELLGRCLECFTALRIVACVTRLQRPRTTDTSRREAADRRLVQSILDDADAASHPLVRMSHLETAAAAARRHEVKDLAEQAVRGMQRLKDEDLQWITITAESEMPPTVAEGYLRMFDESPE
jgi:ferredoxin